MNAQEAGILLAAMSSIDNREVDAVRAQGLAFILEDIPFDIARLALKPAYREAALQHGYVDAGAIRRHAEPILRRVAASVRSARARGWVAKDWPEERPLPPEIEQRLLDEYQANNDRPEDITGAIGPAVDLGEIGRQLPEPGDEDDQ